MDFENKDHHSYRREYDSFLRELKQFHTHRGTPLVNIPSISGKRLDLYLLYNKVTALGGWQKVNNEFRWEEIQEHFGLPRACTHSANALRNAYIRFLALYEKVHFFGEDCSDSGFLHSKEQDVPGRKKKVNIFSEIPLRYNHNQHRISDTVRYANGLSTDLVPESEFKKLEMALLSGLPNEVDFVTNVCLLMSTGGKAVMKLEKASKLLELLVAHVGIFREGPGSLFSCYEEAWKEQLDRRFLQFWTDTVADAEIRDLVIPTSLLKDEQRRRMVSQQEHDQALLNTGRDVGIYDKELQRIIQIISIIRNLSFEQFNMEPLATNLLIFRFLLMCIYNKYPVLKQLALDTMANIAEQMVLDPIDHRTTQLTLQTITKCVSSHDKQEVVRGMEVLAKLCQVEDNDDIISENLEQRVYEAIVSMLTVHDIQIIVHTLEVLYQLSELGETATTHIAEVSACVDTLVNLTTVEAQSYGPSSLVGIKVVEHIPASQVLQQQQQQQQQMIQKVAPPTQAASQTQTPAKGVAQNAAATRVTVSQGHASTPPPHKKSAQRQLQPQAILPQRPPTPAATPPSLDGEALACNWLQTHYEIFTGSTTGKMELLAEYLGGCRKYSIKHVINSDDFYNCVQATFPGLEFVKIQKEKGAVDVVYKGLHKKAVPLPFPTYIDRRIVATPPPTRVFQVNVSHTMLGPSASPSPILPVQEVPTPPGTPQMIRPVILGTPPPASPSIAKQSPLPSPNNYPTIQKALMGGEPPGSPHSSDGGKTNGAANLPKHHPQSQFNRTGRPADSNLIKTLLANKVSRSKLQSQSSTDSSSVPQSPTLSIGGQVSQSPTPLVGADSPAQLSREFQMSPAAQPTLQAVHGVVQQQQMGVPYGDPGGMLNTPTAQMTQIPADILGIPASGYIDSVPPSTKSKKSSKPVKRKLAISPTQTAPKKSKCLKSKTKEEIPVSPNQDSGISMDICQNVERARTAVKAEKEAHQAHIERIPNFTTNLDCGKGHMSNTKEGLKTSSVAQSEIKDSLIFLTSSNPVDCVKSAVNPAENAESKTTSDIVSSSQFNGDPSICNESSDTIPPDSKSQQISSEETIPSPVSSVLAENDFSENNIKQKKMAINGVICHIGNGDYMEELLAKESNKDISKLKQNDLSQNCDVYHAKYENKVLPNGAYTTSSSLVATKSKLDQTSDATCTRTSQIPNESQSSSVTCISDVKSQCTDSVHCGELTESKPKTICADGAQCLEAVSTNCLNSDENMGNLTVISSDRNNANTACSDGLHCTDGIHCGSDNGDPETQKCTDGIHCGSENGDSETQKCSDGVHCGSEHGDEGTQNCTDGIHCGSDSDNDDETHKCTDGIHCGSENSDAETQKYTNGLQYESENNDLEHVETHCGSENGDPKTVKYSNGLHCESENNDLETQCTDGVHCGSENGDPDPQKCNDGIHCGSENGDPDTQKCTDGVHCGSENGDPDTQKCNDGIHCGSENGDPDTQKCTDGIHCGSEHGNDNSQECTDGIHCGTDESDQEENGPPYEEDPNIMQEETEMPSESDLASQLLSDSMNCEDNPENEAIIAEAVMTVDASSQDNLEENQMEDSNLNSSNLEVSNLDESDSLFDPENLLDPITFQPPMEEDSQPEDILAIASKEIADSFNMEDESEESLLSPGISTPLDSSNIVVPNIVQNQPIAAKPVPGMTQQVIIAPAQQTVVSGGQTLVAGQIVLAQNNLISQPPVALVRFVAPQQNSNVPGAMIPQQQALVSVSGTVTNQMPMFVAASSGQPGMVSYPTTMVAVQGAQGKGVTMGNIPLMQQTIVQHNMLPQQNIVRTQMPGTVMAATSAPMVNGKLPLTGKIPIPANPNQQIVYTTCSVIAPQRSTISPPPTIQVPTCPMMSGALTSPSDTASSYTPSPSTTPAPSPGLKRPADGTKPKKKKKKRKKSKDERSSGGSAALSPMSQMYMCEWANCKQYFLTAKEVQTHVIRVHFNKTAPFLVCLWENCDGVERRRWSFMQHMQDRHISEHLLKAAVLRRQQVSQSGAVSPSEDMASCAPPAYPPDAALQAIKRFTARPPYPDFVEPKEGPVTKHIRLTAALILRNLARYSSYGRSVIKRHEQQLSYVALSNVEASNALTSCLWELQQHH